MGLHILTALVTLSITWLLFRAAKSPGLYGKYRAIKNHLDEFGRAWLLLSIYYLIRLALPASLTDTLVSPENSLNILLWHTLVMLVCAVTNVFLRRAILELELFSARPELRTLTLSKRIYFFLTNDGILWSFVVSIGLLFFPSVLSNLKPGVFVILAYFAQLIVSSFLFARLGVAYYQAIQARDLEITAWLYAFLQLSYPILALASTSRVFELVLTLNKFTLGALAIRAGMQVSRRADALDVGHSPAPLENLGKKMLRQASLQVMLQSGVAILAVLAVIVAASKGYLSVVNWAIKSSFPLWQVLLIRTLWLVPLWLAFQLIAYFTLTNGFRVRWTAHGNGALASLLRVDGPGTRLYKNWTKISLSAKSISSERPVQVVLLHGIFSRADKCWGLLPAILIHSGKVARVHLLSYKHSLWTPASQLKELGEEASVNLRTIIESSKEPTIIFAHSLGGLLVMRALANLFSQESRRLLEKIKHVVFIASPLVGTHYAYLCWPWSWSRALAPRSNFIASLLAAFAEQIPPPLTVVGEEKHYCTTTFFYGIRDKIVGRLASLITVPGRRAHVPDWHSLSSIYSLSSPQAASYLAELTAPSRSASLMRFMALNLIGKRTPRLGFLFEFIGGRSLADAIVIEEFAGEWGERLQLAGVGADRIQGALQDLLRSAYEHATATADPGRRDWNIFWKDLANCFDMAFQSRELVRFTWPTGEALLLFCNGTAGFITVVPEDSDRYQRKTEYDLLLANVATYFADNTIAVDPLALATLLSKTCTHSLSLVDSVHQDEKLACSAIVDGSRNYFAVYERTGVVAKGKTSQGILVHAAAFGPSLRFDDLKITGIDLLEDASLYVEPLERTARCHLWRINFLRGKQAGEIYSVRWFIQWPHCMSLDSDIDTLNLSILENKPGMIKFNIQVPCAPARFSSAVIAGQGLTMMRPSETVLDPDRKLYRLGLSLRPTADMDAVLLYYKLRDDKTLTIAEMIEMIPACDNDLKEIETIAKTSEVYCGPKEKGRDLSERALARKYLLAKAADRIVGFLETQESETDDEKGRCLSISAIVVVRAFRGFGIGRKLAGSALERAFHDGFHAAQVTAPDELRGFFETLGFSAIATVPSIKGQSLLRKSL